MYRACVDEMSDCSRRAGPWRTSCQVKAPSADRDSKQDDTTRWPECRTPVAATMRIDAFAKTLQPAARLSRRPARSGNCPAVTGLTAHPSSITSPAQTCARAYRRSRRSRGRDGRSGHPEEITLPSLYSETRLAGPAATSRRHRASHDVSRPLFAFTTADVWRVL